MEVEERIRLGNLYISYEAVLEDLPKKGTKGARKALKERRDKLEKKIRKEDARVRKVQEAATGE